MQELVAKHEQQLRQVYALHTQRSTRDGPQPIDRDQARVIEHHGGEMSQRSLVEDDGASENGKLLVMQAVKNQCLYLDSTEYLIG